MVRDLTKGLNAISQDVDQIIYRMKMLGFNSVRLPMTFDNVWGLGQVCASPNVATVAWLHQGSCSTVIDCM